MDLIRNNIKNLEEYEPNNMPYRIKLDANEGKNILFLDINKDGIRFTEDFYINLYPDSDATLLRTEIGKYLNINPDNIVAGNGSSEMIELIMKTFIDKDDIILSFVPTFSMYSIFSKIYSAKFVGVKSNDDFSTDMNVLIRIAKEIKPKIIFLCNPNNPTGYLTDKNEIKRLLENVDSIVVVDEAYMEFARDSMIEEISQYNNLIVLRTLSKALGLAAIRLGYMVACEDIIKVMKKVKSPYNLNSISQYMGIEAFKSKDKILKYVEEVKTERDYLYGELIKLPLKVYKSDGNFIFFKSDVDKLSKKLQKEGVLIRSFSGDLEGYYRVTVGIRWENEVFLKTLKEILKNENS